MNIETLRLILLLVRSRLLKPGQVAKAVRVSRATVYRWLVWRQKPLTQAAVDALLDVAGATKLALSRPVRVTPEEVADAVRWYRLDVSEAEIRVAAEDVPGLADVFKDGPLKARR